MEALSLNGTRLSEGLDELLSLCSESVSSSTSVHLRPLGIIDDVRFPGMSEPLEDTGEEQKNRMVSGDTASLSLPDLRSFIGHLL